MCAHLCTSTGVPGRADLCMRGDVWRFLGHMRLCLHSCPYIDTGRASEHLHRPELRHLLLRHWHGLVVSKEAWPRTARRELHLLHLLHLLLRLEPQIGPFEAL